MPVHEMNIANAVLAVFTACYAWVIWRRVGSLCTLSLALSFTIGAILRVAEPLHLLPTGMGYALFLPVWIGYFVALTAIYRQLIKMRGTRR